MIVGVHGKARSGKDTIANILTKAFNYRRLAFADPLKHEVARTLNSTLTAYVDKVYRTTFTHINPRTCYIAPDGTEFKTANEIINHMIWKNRDPFFRSLLQEWGTELRRNDDLNYWTKKWRRTIGDDFPTTPMSNIRVVAPDMRFPNEFAMIHAMGGVTIHVERPFSTEIQAGDGFTEQRHHQHASETLLDHHTFDVKFINDGTLLDLDQAVTRWMDAVLRNQVRL